MLIRDSGIVLHSDYPSFQQIKKDLTYRGSDWNDEIVTYELYEKINNHTIKIPRFYPLDEINIEDKTEPGDDIDIKSTIVPRFPSQEKSINYLIENRNCILKLEPGRGKTVIAIAAISKIGKKSIIFTHKDSLRKNWKDEFLKHTNCKEDDISFLNTKSYKKQFEKSIIIISTIQAFISGLKKPDFVNELKKTKFGIVIFDECHTTIGPDKFTQASMNINSNRVYGLSATPIRFDIPDILKWHCGDIKYFEPNKGELVKPTVYMCYFSFGVWKRYRAYLNWGGKFQYQRYYKQMLKIDNYFEKVVPIIQNAHHKAHRKILVLGTNIKTLIKLAEQCKFEKEKVGIFIPGSNERQKLSVSDITNIDEAFKTKDAVFSTYGACRDGNNRPDLDFLIMSTPTSNVEQAGGRILRSLEGKSDPVIIDLVDTEGPRVWSTYETEYSNVETKIGLFEKSAEKRQEIYKSLGWNFKIKYL